MWVIWLLLGVFIGSIGTGFFSGRIGNMYAPDKPTFLVLTNECTIPPEGWRCTRGNGHEGPCAAIEENK